MKNYIILLAITLGFYSAKAQDFKETEKYTVINERVLNQEEQVGSALIDLVSADDLLNTKTTLKIAELELLEAIHISVLENPELDAVSEILKVELEYVACCSSSDTYYFLVNDDASFTALPRIENVYCDGGETDTHYIFPIQEYGIEGTILRAEQQYTENYMIKDIEVLQSFVWNDDDFGDEEAITAIN